MKTLASISFALLTASVLPGVARAGDAEGCTDLKLFPRLEGCAIIECSAKQHDSFDSGDASGSPLDASTSSLVYSCPSGDLQRMKRDMDAQLRKAGYQNVGASKADLANSGMVARKSSQWIEWSVISEDGTTSYSITSATVGGEKLNGESCTPPPVFSALKQCQVVECASKSEDSAAMRIAQKEETALTGGVQTLTLACPSTSAAQALSSVEGELKTSGYEILFSDRERPESAWVTARAGKRWVELVSAPDGESVSYTLTMIASGEVLSASKQTPVPVGIAEPPAAPASATVATAAPAPTLTTPEPTLAAKPTPEAKSTQETKPAQTAAIVAPSAAASATPEPVAQESAPAVISALTAPAAPSHPDLVPPKPILEVPIEATHERIYSVTGDVVISMLVDVGADGLVTNAVLTGRITNDVRKLESAALEAVSHWRFEPARQDGQAVAATKVLVQIHFHGRPWRF